MKLLFRAEGAPPLVKEVLQEEGWSEWSGSGGISGGGSGESSFADEAENGRTSYHLHWQNGRFRKSDIERATEYQRLNHFPNTGGITRKPIWICKPADLSRGRKIFLFRELQELVYDCSVVVQRYISTPLLISGYKWDLRTYVLVTSFHPLQIYLHSEGLVRFATVKYDTKSLQDLYSHLTNTSINKYSPAVNDHKQGIGAGCKYKWSDFTSTLESMKVDVKKLWRNIEVIIMLTVMSVSSSVPKTTTSCFELFGFDIIVDENHLPWLLEVNCAPALTVDCEVDTEVKKPVLQDLLKVIDFQSIANTAATATAATAATGRKSKPVSVRASSSSASTSTSQYSGKSVSSALKANTSAAKSQRQREAQTFQPRHCGGFDQIFPFNSTSYLLSVDPVNSINLKQVIPEVRSQYKDVLTAAHHQLRSNAPSAASSRSSSSCSSTVTVVASSSRSSGSRSSSSSSSSSITVGQNVLSVKENSSCANNNGSLTNRSTLGKLSRGTGTHRVNTSGVKSLR